MMTVETYTRVFLKALGVEPTLVAVKEHMPLWWYNTRKKDLAGLRLTEAGFQVIKNLEITVYQIFFPPDFKLTTQIVIFLDQFIDCPYYLEKDSIFVTGEKKCVELSLFSGDVKKYGLIRAIRRQKAAGIS